MGLLNLEENCESSVKSYEDLRLNLGPMLSSSNVAPVFPTKKPPLRAHGRQHHQIQGAKSTCSGLPCML